MKLLTTVLGLFSVVPLVSAKDNSEKFHLQSINPGTELQNQYISIENGKLVINGNNDAPYSCITNQGQFAVGDSFVYFGPNSELALTTDTKQAQSGFWIEQGTVKYSSGFYAVKDGNGFDLFNGDSNGQTQIGFTIEPVKDDGTVVEYYNPYPIEDPSPSSASSVSQPSQTLDPIPVNEGDSKPFYLVVIRSGSSIQNQGVSFKDGSLVVDGHQSPPAHVTQDGYLAIGPYYLASDSQSKMILVTDKSAAENGFSIQQGRVIHGSLGYWANNYGTSTFSLYFGESNDSDSLSFVFDAFDVNNGAGLVPDFPENSTTILPQTISSSTSASSTSVSSAPVSSASVSSALAGSTSVSSTPVSSTSASSTPVNSPLTNTTLSSSALTSSVSVSSIPSGPAFNISTSARSATTTAVLNSSDSPAHSSKTSALKNIATSQSADLFSLLLAMITFLV